MAKKPRAIFLDRDGTLVHDRPGFYLFRPSQLRIYPFVFKALRELKNAGYRLVLITNQSGIGRGLLNLSTLKDIHRRLRKELRRHGADIDGIYFCPHRPEDNCACRKPSPQLVRRAAREMGLSLKGSIVIGDKKTDLDLARNLGLPSVHVGTGHGRNEKARFGPNLKATYQAPNLLSAARWILQRR